MTSVATHDKIQTSENSEKSLSKQQQKLTQHCKATIPQFKKKQNSLATPHKRMQG